MPVPSYRMRERMNRIAKALQRQMDLNQTKNMLYAQLDRIIEIDPDFLAALELLINDKQALSELALRDSISFASSMLLNRLYSINQFLQVDEQQVQILEDIYRRTWRKIVETKNIQATLEAHHYPELAGWIADLYPADFLDHLKKSPTIGCVVCVEYSPQLQIGLLRIDVGNIKQPLLDIGCGSTAGLVRHLRALQIEAYGIDRQIEKGEAYLNPMDWFSYRFEPGTWGTITSNMAFTNHLLYTYHHDTAQLGLYVHKFNEIVASLVTGGSFHYAPSVPFLEQRLETDEYIVERFDIVKEISMTRITSLH